MPRHHLTNLLAATIDQVENTLWRTGRFHDFGEDQAGNRRDLGRLENHRAARRNGRGDLADDLVERPVPGCNQSTDADRLPDDPGRAALLGEFEALEGRDRRFEMCPSCPGLRVTGEGKRRSHFPAHCLGNFLETRVVGLENTLQQRQALRPVRLRETGERRLGRSHGAVHIGLGPDRDRRERLLGRGIGNIEDSRDNGIHPSAVYEELQMLGHMGSTWERIDCFELFVTGSISASPQDGPLPFFPARMRDQRSRPSSNLYQPTCAATPMRRKRLRGMP